jgi:hypothetical protein
MIEFDPPDQPSLRARTERIDEPDDHRRHHVTNGPSGANFQELRVGQGFEREQSSGRLADADDPCLSREKVTSISPRREVRLSSL